MKKIIGICSILVTVLCFNTNAQDLLEKKHGVKVLQPKHQKSGQVNKLKFMKTAALQKPSKLDYYEWNLNASDWEFIYKSELTYNSNGLLASERMLDELGNEQYRTTYTYDNNRRLVNYLAEMKMGSTWIGMEKYIAEYNASGDLILEESSYFSAGKWEVMYGKKVDITFQNNVKTIVNYENYSSGYDTIDKYILTYNANNLLATEEHYYFNGNNVFIPSEQYEYLYDQNNVDTGMIKRLWDTNTWRNNLIYCNYTWDNPQKDFLSGTKIYYFSLHGLAIYQRETYTRDANGSFSYLLEKEDNGNWVGDMRINIVHDEHKNRILYDYDLNFGNGWEQLFMIVEEYVYDANGNASSHVYKESDSNGILENKYKKNFTEYVNVTGISDSKYKFVKAYPNPSSDRIFIELKNSNGSKYQVLDLSGRVVMDGELQNNEINISSLNNGLYIVQIGEYRTKISKKF